MGLTNAAVGRGAANEQMIVKSSPEEHVIALAGNPNVGKSTVFNALTGMNQHTGNWPGKTVANAQGICKFHGKTYRFVDIPGTYSLSAHSAEEEIARNFLCFGQPDAVIVICDATCLERNLNLVLQTLELCPNTIVGVNLMDEAARTKIHVDLPLLSERLGIPVIGIVARKKKTLFPLLQEIKRTTDGTVRRPFRVNYGKPIEQAVSLVEAEVKHLARNQIDSRWLSLRLLNPDKSLRSEIDRVFSRKFLTSPSLFAALDKAHALLQADNCTDDRFEDRIACTLIQNAERICDGVVTQERKPYSGIDRRFDRVLTGRWTAFPLMTILLAFVFWLTISGANAPSRFLSYIFQYLQTGLTDLLDALHTPPILKSALLDGVFRVLSNVVSVMLPPMAIFFPLFTLLEDVGYLPRIAYNLDRPFHWCRACGKQALTMCMGFGCNAAGVVGCRIIDSPRERLLAVLTNSLVPCNGRFPLLITMMSMLLIAGQHTSAFLSSFLLTGMIIFAVAATLLMTRLLSVTLLRGFPSSFALELPPYRKPQIGKVLVRSVFDRTLFVLGRAAAVAAPAGLIIWGMANLQIEGVSILARCSDFLDPFARLLGLDGVILMAFILGFPANEIVIPIIIMAYLSGGTLTDLSSFSEMRALFAANGWTALTALNVTIFSLFHWPCSTTLWTIKKETGKWRWAFLAASIPT
ncbi:MAG: ferrous iron transport protein B, partial [Clostridia bacterium]|nr:ferrous iron transport protein B [Clostridia bacterium]